jgi:predicted nucleic acid-binding protein
MSRVIFSIPVEEPDSLERVPKAADPGLGERIVLALGLQTPASVLILDDGLARVHALIDRLGSLGFRLSSQARAAVLKLAGE